MYSDLVKIAEIRNEVAHYHLYLSFNSEEVKKKCSELAYLKSLKNGASEESLNFSKYMNDARSQFVMSVVMISQRLLLIGLGTNNNS
ncbi:MAG: hypothetical protein HQK84_05635 [Nitrospinae bacterium]|nr:hypothetical protein [Nitrospinota bacterium]